MALIKKTGEAKIPGAPAKGTVLGGKTAPEGDPSEQQAAGAAAAASSETKGAGTATAEKPAAAAPAAAVAPAAASTSTAVAVQAPKAVAMTAASIQSMDVVGQCRDAYRVDWNTLERVQANQGSFLDLGKNKVSMGDEIQLQLLSWQQTWQVSPGSDDVAAKEFVRYSDDGITTKQGENIAEYLDSLRQQYPKAKCDERCMVVGVLVGASKDSRLEGELVQLDLSATSRQNFDRYRLTTAYKIGKGLLAPEAAQLMTMKAEIATSPKDSRSWTVVHFSPTVLEDATA